MADYRDWCHSCGNEINFWGHKPDCEAQARVRQAQKEAKAFEEEQWTLLERKGVEQVSDELAELINDIMTLDAEVRAMERKKKFMQDFVRYNSSSRDELKEKYGFDIRFA